MNGRAAVMRCSGGRQDAARGILPADHGNPMA